MTGGVHKSFSLLNHKAQKSVKAHSTEKVSIEIIKYSTKIFTEPDPNSKNKKKASRKMYMAAMYNIISAMKGHRLFDRFGFNLPKTTSKKESKMTKLIDYDNWIYNSSQADWFSEPKGDVFAIMNLMQDFKILANNIDGIKITTQPFLVCYNYFIIYYILYTLLTLPEIYAKR